MARQHPSGIDFSARGNRGNDFLPALAGLGQAASALDREELDQHSCDVAAEVVHLQLESYDLMESC